MDKDNKSGFSGLADLASEVEESVESNNPRSKKMEVASEADKTQRSSALTEGQDSSEVQSNIKKKRNSRFVSGDKWVILLILGLGLIIWFEDNERQGEKNPSQNVSAFPSQSDVPQQGVFKPNTPKRQPYYVTADSLNLRESPSTNSPVLHMLDRFDTVYFSDGSETNDWIKVDSGHFEGWVAKKYLEPGNGSIAKRNYCMNNVSRPKNGTVFEQISSGPHRLIIHNGQGQDILAKLKNRSGRTIVSFYVRDNESVTISNIPSGEFKFQYAAGENYSTACGNKFLTNMHASEDPAFNAYQTTSDGYYEYSASMEYTLRRVANGNLRPQSIPADQF